MSETSFDGYFNLKLYLADLSAESPSNLDNGRIDLVTLNENDLNQTWVFRPIRSFGSPAHTIQNAFTGAYVVPKDDVLSYGLNPYVWHITSPRDYSYLIQSAPPGTSPKYWNPSGDEKYVILSGSTSRNWRISFSPGIYN